MLKAFRSARSRGSDEEVTGGPAESSVVKRAVIAAPPPTGKKVGGINLATAAIRRTSTAVFKRKQSTLDAPRGEPSAQPLLLHTVFIQCDTNEDGFLSRSDFTKAVEMVLDAEQEQAFFEELTVDLLDDEWDAAGGTADEEVSLEMFESWARLFHRRYVAERKLLRGLGITCAHRNSTPLSQTPNCALLSDGLRSAHSSCP